MCLTTFGNTEKGVENTTRSGVFFDEVCGNVSNTALIHLKTTIESLRVQLRKLPITGDFYPWNIAAGHPTPYTTPSLNALFTANTSCSQIYYF